MHPMIAQRAFETLPESMKAELMPHVPAILWGSTVPDLLWQDWENHVWDVHGGPVAQGRGPEKVAELMDFLTKMLAETPRDAGKIAFHMGILSHYISDLNQPLHTDDYALAEAWVHEIYEEDAWIREEEIPIEFRGFSLYPDPYSSARSDAERANHYYEAIIRAYTEGNGFESARGVTAISLQRAVEDTANAWITAWAAAVSKGPTIGLRVNAATLEPGATFRLSVSVLPGQGEDMEADVHLALWQEGFGFLFLAPDGTFRPQAAPAISAWRVGALEETECLSGLVPPEAPPGRYAWCAAFVRPGGDPLNPDTWLGDPAVVPFTVRPLSLVRVTDLSDEVYLLPGRRPGDGSVSLLPVRQWDFLFLGGLTDDPTTAEDERETDPLIPGAFNHLMLYMGRDRSGTAYGLEMTTNISFDAPYLRIVRLPELEGVPAAGSENLRLPLMTKDIQAYENRWAKRLLPVHRDRLGSVGPTVLEQFQMDMENGFPYDLEIRWSGNLDDKRIFLVDDGRENGGSCTDYWLSLLEDFGGICLRGSRISAAELEDYFLNDPEGTRALVPDGLNPFPFPLTVKDVINLGFHAIDPAPHRFSCDGSQETGLPIPDRLMVQSPDLVEIEPVDPDLLPNF